MKNDGTLSIAVGMSARSKTWKNRKMQWSELVERLTTENKTNETYKEYLNATKAEKSKIKDVGGYVGGYLRGGRRIVQNVVNRQLLTLDVDYAHLNFWSDFKLQFSNAAVLHATHSFTKSSPRYRLIIPLNREVTPDEYVAIGRNIAGVLNIELFDNTTFETHRLMFWPSNPKDVDYYSRFQDGEWLDADEVLASYEDWTDSSLWPTSARNIQEVRDLSKKQQDPEFKRGVIGAFCRTYSVTEAMDKFLKDEYIQAADGRYTYTKGTTASGLVIYDDKFAYSHHGTDPCGGKLCNVFDLVRIHKFGHLDEGQQTAPSKMKSFKEMEKFATQDNLVKKTIAVESIAESKYDFSEELEENIPEEDLEWAEQLEVDAKGKYLSSSTNLNIILMNDSRLKGAFRFNSFDSKRYVFKSLPWRKIKKPEPIKNVDYSGIRNYIESVYGIVSTQKIDDCLALEFEKRSFHPIMDYLKSLEWDGNERVDTLLIDYFGTDDDKYYREAIRKTLVGAVARIMKPGVKFDLVLTLVGSQGTGKSTLVHKLGKGWSSDTFLTVHGKDAFEQLQGAWIIEIAELSGLRKADVESIKHFISKQEDTFRPAYARSSETYHRQCIFIGTTNENSFLRDPTGNRRFMPIDINEHRAKKNIFDLTDDDIDQIWAEAFHMYKAGEKLFLSDDANRIATKEQREHSSVDERKGLIEEYLDKKLPANWDDLDIIDRREYLTDPLVEQGETERNYVCVAEIWCECLNKDRNDMSRYNTREINEIMKGLDGWERIKSTKNFKLYGKQKYYARKLY